MLIVESARFQVKIQWKLDCIIQGLKCNWPCDRGNMQQHFKPIFQQSGTGQEALFLVYQLLHYKYLADMHTHKL